MIELIGKKLTQWDTGRYVQVNDDTIDEVHCCRKGDTHALNVQLERKDGMIIAPIPNILLQKNQRIIVYTVEVSGDERRTVESEIFHVWSRPKPDDYVYTETEVKSYEALEKRITELEKNGGGSGEVSDEQIKNAVDEYFAENPIGIPTDCVKSVNGIPPDENGNVEVDVGGGEICDLLIDVTTTERVNNVSRTIDNIAYKQLIVWASNVCGHADNNTNAYTPSLTVENNLSEKSHLSVIQCIINQNTTPTHAKIVMFLTDKVTYGHGHKNVNAVNSVSNGGAATGLNVTTWNSNVLKRVAFGTDVYANTMEIGANIKIWGVRA